MAPYMNPTPPLPPADRYGAGRRILVAEDDHEMRSLLALTLRHDGFEVVEARNGMEFMEHLTPWLGGAQPLAPVDVIVSDVQMPCLSGLEVLAGLSAIRHCPPVVLMTAFGDAQTHSSAASLGAVAVLDKPFDVDALRALLCSVLEQGANPPADVQRTAG
ncbi:response regulator [Chondromyces apiculatus]|uniref:Response regulator receiver protein n=1 Tax=Chondromyces apiculatus DSM 436 TaxID=1192034 RepID=A0A017TCJ7_9BACT|nr:response regulator [Chondromyces apiculatus]EYF06622.1 response regulator receiver protein [Chondromyces apiculatus DSM 436]